MILKVWENVWVVDKYCNAIGLSIIQTVETHETMPGQYIKCGIPGNLYLIQAEWMNVSKGESEGMA